MFSRRILGLALGALTLAAGAAASPAGAATVSVQIEGLTQVRAPITVQTPASIARAGFGACPGGSAIGALDVAVAGDWAGQTFGVDAVLGESHVFGSGAYWSIYVNGRYQNAGACDIALADGDQILLFASDDPFTSGVAGYDEPVILEAPATVAPGTPFTVTVREATTTFDSQFAGTTAFTPAAGATVTAAGGTTVTTGADGTATLTLSAGGPAALVATKGNRAPDRLATCVTNGADGQCGTTVPPPPDTTAAFGRITSVGEGRIFAKGKGPRLLGGRVDAERSGIADVRLRLTRNDRTRCSTFDATTLTFKRMSRCGAARGRWFSAGTTDIWTYLLPAKLTRGRYVLDVEVVDKAGNRDTGLARGRNRIVFFVR